MAWKWLGLAFLVACTGPDGPADGTGEGKEDRGDRPAFYEVDPSRSSAAFRDYVGGALALLEKHDSEIARLTARSIRDGRVKIDELVDLTCWDFDRLRRELTEPLEPGDYSAARNPRTTVARTIASEIDGYMWSDRIYVARGMTAKRLAATLVHEVNHVINRSEIGYWDDLPTSAFLHEYRAFHAERIFDPASYRGIDLTEHVLFLYDLDGEALAPEVRAEPLTPRLLPDAAAWQARRVGDDPADVDADCPSY